MPSWNEVLSEIQKKTAEQGPLDQVRRNHLKNLYDHTGRNTIIYYSGWLQNGDGDAPLQSIIFDGDMNSFMTTIHGMDTSKGLDLILHTPGGVASATEAIVNYLRAKFGTDIRCFVPQLAMSAGTMIACACKEIYMGKQSSIGPIDPQFGSMAAQGVVNEFKQVIEDIKKHPEAIPMWQAIYSKIPAGFITKCQQAINASTRLALEWLRTGLFKDDEDAEKKAQKIVNFLNSNKDIKEHDRHIMAQQAKEIGLKVKMLEDDQELQDLVLTVHHACMHTFSLANGLQKIVENQNGIGMFLSSNR